MIQKIIKSVKNSNEVTTSESLTLRIKKELTERLARESVDNNPIKIEDQLFNADFNDAITIS